MAGSAAIIVNGRFLRTAGAHASGVQRVGRGVVDGARAAGIPLEVIAPNPTNDARVDRQIWCPPGRWGERMWEQILLPLAARGRPILSLANTAPIAFGRSVVMIHDLAPLQDRASFSASGRRHGRLLMASARRAFGVLTLSEATRKELVAIGIPENRAFVVRPAVDGFFPSSADEVDAVRARYGLEGPFVLHVGWSVPRKDVNTIVTAHLQALAEAPHQLVLVGTVHPMFVAVRPPTAPSIRVLGYVDDVDLRTLMTCAAAFLYPSRYEGFGLPPLEAMACGAPALVSDIPVLRESTAGRAFFVPRGNVDAWARAILDAVRGGIPAAPPPAWSWADAAGQLRAALVALGFL